MKRTDISRCDKGSDNYTPDPDSAFGDEPSDRSTLSQSVKSGVETNNNYDNNNIGTVDPIGVVRAFLAVVYGIITDTVKLMCEDHAFAFIVFVIIGGFGMLVHLAVYPEKRDNHTHEYRRDNHNGNSHEYCEGTTYVYIKNCNNCVINE